MSTMITTPTFIVGLGGIGNLVTRLVWERYRSSNRTLPETVRIRSIDTADQHPDEATERLPDAMFTRVGEFQATAVIQRLDLHPEVQRWWDYPAGAFAPGYIANGAGAKRPVGRLVFFHQFRRIHDEIKTDLAAPLRDTVQMQLINQKLSDLRKTPRVFVVGSLAGGTCSGMFLDVAILLRHLIRTLGYDATGAQIVGVFGLPSVIHLASGDGASAQGRQRQVNTSAALAELDFLTHHWPKGIEVEYPLLGRIHPEPPLLDQIFLFTSTKLDGVSFGAQQDVLRRVAHFIFGQTALGMGEATLQFMDNAKQYFDPATRAVVDGLPAVYGSFGVEWLEVPHDALLPAWIDAIADSVAKRVTDFAWEEEPRHNLNRVARERLFASDEGLRVGLDIFELTPETVMTLSGLPDLGALLGPIQSAQKKAELQDALAAFETQLPGTIEGVKKRLRVVATVPPEERIRSVAADLVADSAFRIGGARRVLEHAAEMLGAFTQSLPSTAPVQDIVAKCGGGLFKALDVGPALSWARERVLRHLKGLAQGELQSRAAGISGFCREWSKSLTTLQETVRREAAGLREGAKPSRSSGAETWLLTERDIAASIAANKEEASRAVAESLSQAFASTVRSGSLPAAGLSDFFRDLFRREAIEAIDREAARFVRRPDDAFDRIRSRVRTCAPMAHIITSGNELLEVMKAERVATPMKLVLTGMPDGDRQKLEQWARQHSVQAGDDSAFQVARSNDSFRDDALHLTFGWPLCLFREVQACTDQTARAVEADSNADRNSRILRSIPGTVEHQVRPLSEGDAKRLFAYAVVLKHVRPVRLDRVEFDTDRFPGQSDAASLGEGFRRFRLEGLNRRYREWLDVEQARDTGAFRQLVTQALERLRAALAGDGIPTELRGPLREHADRVEQDLRGLVAY